MHYTYGQDLSEDGDFTPGARGFWHWDKREYEVGTMTLHLIHNPIAIRFRFQCTR